MRAVTLDDRKPKDLLSGGNLCPAWEQVCYVSVTVRFPPEFLSRPFGAPYPRERELIEPTAKTAPGLSSGGLLMLWD